MTFLHTIPVGGEEPIHRCNAGCWCHPLRDEGMMVHNAKDLRDAHERNGRVDEEKKLVLVYEDLP